MRTVTDINDLARELEKQVAGVLWAITVVVETLHDLDILTKKQVADALRRSAAARPKAPGDEMMRLPVLTMAAALEKAQEPDVLS